MYYITKHAAHFPRQKCVIYWMHLRFECSGSVFMLSDICCRLVEHIHEGLLAFSALLPSLYPEGEKRYTSSAI